MLCMVSIFSFAMSFFSFCYWNAGCCNCCGEFLIFVLRAASLLTLLCSFVIVNPMCSLFGLFPFFAQNRSLLMEAQGAPLWQLMTLKQQIREWQFLAALFCPMMLTQILTLSQSVCFQAQPRGLLFSSQMVCAPLTTQALPPWLFFHLLPLKT